ncbi:MAG TPA: biotin/lipoyl-containing protein [Lachnospiraceae bacterium]|nr:biotin/lipoyl-containing protein [Lachnospiraceae bacterium]
MKNYTITVNGNVYDVVVEEGASTGASIVAKAPVAKAAPVATKAAPVEAKKESGAAGSIKIEAGAAGKVFKVEVNVGQAVKANDTLIVLEAMKMEIPIVAPEDGVVASIEVSVGDAIEAGAVLVTLN